LIVLKAGRLPPKPATARSFVGLVTEIVAMVVGLAATVVAFLKVVAALP
jgi:hypothetical protein